MILAALLLLGGAGGGCTIVEDEHRGGSTLAGRIDLDGSSTLEPFIALAAERFQDENPRVAVVVSISPSRTGGGFERFCTGETDISTASRRIEEHEERACDGQGIDYVELEVAIDALTVVVNSENDWVDCLTIDELREIWEPGSGVRRWNDVNPAFPDEELELYGASDNSGTFDYFTAVIVGAEGASRSDYTANEDDFETARDASDAEGAMGYFGRFFYAESDDTLKALEIDDGSGCVPPTVEAVQSGEYALARPLYVYAKTEALKQPSVTAFLDYTLDNASDLAEAARLVPVPASELRREQAELDRIRTRTGASARGSDPAGSSDD